MLPGPWHPAQPVASLPPPLARAQAYARLQSIVTHANMVMSSFESERFMSEADAVLAHEGAKDARAGAALDDAKWVGHGGAHVPCQ